VAIFKLTDGQTVSIYFHNPDAKSTRIAPTDEVISWKWLLNKKDITIVVAPERGVDLNLFDVARRVMRLAERNSALFTRQNARRAERIQSVQSLKDEIATLETELASAQNELEVAKQVAEDAQNQKTRAFAAAVQQSSATQDAYIRATNNNGVDPKTGMTKADLNAKIDEEVAQVEQLRGIANGVVPKDQRNAQAADEPAQQAAEDRQEQQAQGARNNAQAAQSGGGAAGNAGGAPDLTYRTEGMFTTFMPETSAGQNAWRVLAAKNEGSGNVLAIHAEDTIGQLRAAGYVVAEATGAQAMTPQEDDDLLAALGNPAPVAAANTSAPNEQALIAAYIASLGQAAAAINAAVAAVNWDAITDTASMRGELYKLSAASGAAQRDLVNPAAKALEDIGITEWDERLSGFRNIPEHAAIMAAGEAERAASLKIQAVAKERLIAKGVSEVAALTAQSSLADVAAAIFRKAGIEMDGKTAQIVSAIEAKDAALAWSVLRNLDNKASAEIFERATGIKLAKTQRDRLPQIDAWAGITPEQRAELKAKEEAERKTDARERNVRSAWGALKQLSIRDSSAGTIADGQQYMVSQFNDGYTEINVYKVGASQAYRLRNGERLKSAKSRVFNDFLKAALAFGGLREALQLVGAAQAEPARLWAQESQRDLDPAGGAQAIETWDTAKADALLAAATAADPNKPAAPIARDFIANYLQGRIVKTKLGDCVFNATSRSELSLSVNRKNSLKIRVVPRVPEILIEGDTDGVLSPVEGRGSKNVEQHKIDGFYKFTKTVDLRDVRVFAEVKVGHRENDVIPMVYSLSEPGVLLDSAIKEGSIAGAFSRMPIIAHSATGYKPADMGSNAPWDSVLFKRHAESFDSAKAQAVACDAEGTVSASSAILDASAPNVNDDDDGLNIQILAVWDKDGNELDPETLEPLKPKDTGSSDDLADVQKIAAVDAAYRFDNATDEFKAWVYKSLNQADYSPFATAKAMDEAAKRNGAGVEWGIFGKAALDDANEGNAPDQPGAGLDQEPEGGDDEDLFSEEEIDGIVDDESMTLGGAADESEIGETFDAEEAVLDDAFSDTRNQDQRAVVLRCVESIIPQAQKFERVFGRSQWAGYTKKLISSDDYLKGFVKHRVAGDMAKIKVALSKAGESKDLVAVANKLKKMEPTPDAAVLDSLDGDSYVGKIMQGGAVVGRIDICADGKAMVYLGASGDQRVIFTSSVDGERLTALYSDDDAPLMVDWLFENLKQTEADAPAVELTGKEPGDFPDTTDNEGAPGPSANSALTEAGFKQVASNDYVRAVKAGDKTLQFNIRVAAEHFFINLTISFAGGITGAATRLGSSPDVETAIEVVKNEIARRTEPAAQDADRALFQSVIDGTVADILAPELADALEAAYLRNQTDSEMASLFERAVNAYQDAMLKATANLS
jgi:hypothetical protein